MTGGHVVHVVRSDGFAGVERYIVDTATELSERGWIVDVIGGEPRRMRRELPSAVRHRPAASTVEAGRALWAVGETDVVHAHMTAAELSAALVKRRNRSRLVATRHFARPRGASRLGRAGAPLISRSLDVQIAISQFVAESIGEPSTILRSGVRPAESSLAKRRPVVVVMQRLEREKDTATALRAWALSDLGTRGWQMEIHGRGSEMDSLDALRRELGVAASVTMKGFTDSPRSVLAGSAILLATAPAEPFGLTVVEGMAEAIPVVAATGGAHAETLGPRGTYFPAGDSSACAEQLCRLASSDVLRAEVGSALARRYEAEFTIEKHVDRLTALYASLLGGTP